jgi:iron complex outermembrane recepter protein
MTIKQSSKVHSVRRRLLAGAALNMLLLSGALAQQAPVTPAPANERPNPSSSNQATSSTNVEAIVVTGKRTTVGGGLITAINAPKAASVVTQQFIQDQVGGESSFQLLNLAPGVTVNSSDGTGSYFQQIFVRGFQNQQIGVLMDGVPLNESGSFNTYAQEYINTENLSQIYLTPGAGDADQPNLGATGGVVSMVVREPSRSFHVSANAGIGENNFGRYFVRLDTGEFGGNNTAFLSYSSEAEDTWRGIGHTTKEQVDAKFVHDFDNNNKISLTLFYNNDVAAEYEVFTKAQLAQQGYNFNYAPTFAPGAVPTPGGPVINDNNSATAGAFGQRSNYSGLYYNPFQFFAPTIKLNLQPAPNVRFDFQPYFLYIYGDAGFAPYLSDSNTALLGQPTDLNHDGNTQDNTLYYAPFSEQEYKYGFISRLKWTVGSQELVFGYHFEYANLHEFEPYIPINRSTGIPLTYWPDSKYFLTANGQTVYGENRFTYTTTMRPFFEDTIHLFDDKLTITPGVQFPFVHRDADNLLPLALRTSNGQVAPTNAKLSQSMPLPSLGVRYEISPGSELFASAARTFRATDNTPLFTAGQDLTAIQPESAVDIEGGYRYHGGLLVGSIDAYHIQYANREQSAYNPTVGITIYKNIGGVSIEGLEAELGTVPIHGFTAYVSGSLNTSSLLGDLATGIPGTHTSVILPTKGKQLVDLPNYTLAGQLRYDSKSYFVFIQPKFTGKRYATLMNDQSVDGYVTWDMSAGYKIPSEWTHGVKSVVEVSATNLFDKQYLGAINYTNNANAVNGLAGSQPTYWPGAPRFISVKLRADF